MKRLRELEAEATPGPWRVEEDGNEGMGWVWPHGAYSDHRPDNDFIAEVRNAFPALLDRLEKAEAASERLRTFIEAAMRECERAGDVRRDRRQLLGNVHLMLQDALAAPAPDKEAE